MNEGMIEAIDRTNLAVLIMLLYGSFSCLQRSSNGFVFVNIVIAVKEIHSDLGKYKRPDQEGGYYNIDFLYFHSCAKIKLRSAENKVIL